jgi:hypothetical protein
VSAPSPKTSTRTKKTRRQKPQPHDFVAIPLRDGSFGLGEFLGETEFGQSICVLYGTRQATAAALRDRLDGVTSSDIVGFTQVATREIHRGDWLVIGNHGPSDLRLVASLPKHGSHSGDIIEFFLDAWHSLRSWEDYWFRPILLPHLQPPPQEGVPASTED